MRFIKIDAVDIIGEEGSIRGIGEVVINIDHISTVSMSTVNNAVITEITLVHHDVIYFTDTTLDVVVRMIQRA